MNNPYVAEFVNIIYEVVKWIKYAFLAVTLYKVAEQGLGYQGGDEDERRSIKKAIRKTLIWGGGFFFALWFAQYVIGRFQSIEDTENAIYIIKTLVNV